MTGRPFPPHGGPRSDWRTARRILVVRLDNAGDVVLLSPALAALAEGAPDARITLLASPGGALAAPLLPWVDDVMVHRASWQQLRPGAVAPAAERALMGRLRDEAFDAALVFTSASQTPVAAAYACFLAGIPLRAGFGGPFSGEVLTDAVPPPPDALHHAERNLRLVEGLGFSAPSRAIHVSVPDAARQEARDVLSEAHVRGRYIVLAPGASAPARRYPAPAFAVVARGLHHATGLPVLVAGSQAERALAASVAGRGSAGVVDVAGRTSLSGLAALVEGAALVVANNSLTMHLAEALGVPSVVTYAGTDPHGHWAPRRTPVRLLSRAVECSPCFAIECPYGLECLDVAPAEVIRAADALLRAPARARRGAA